MKEKIYSASCPKHGMNLATKTIKSVRMKNTDTVYTKPVFYCQKCKEYYIFIDEISCDFKSKVILKNGSPIWILGTKVNKMSSSEKKNSPKENEKNGKENKNKIVRSIDEGIIKTNIVLPGSKLPKRCEKCKKDTMVGLKYVIKYSQGKEKEVHGKECSSCGAIFFPESIVDQHKKCFIILNGEIKNEESVSSEIKSIFTLYLNAKGKTTIHNLRKQLVNTKEDISKLLKDSLHQGKEKDEKILYVGMRKYPRIFLRELWDIYKEDTLEFTAKIKTFDFNKGHYYLAAVDLLKEIDTFPSPLFTKLQGNIEFQYLIREEVQKGKVYPSYIKFLSSNIDIILEPWLQQELIKNISRGNNVDGFACYIDLNSEVGMTYINSQDDYVFINYIFEKNLWRVEIDKEEILKGKAQSIFRLREKGCVDKELREFLEKAISDISIQKIETKNEAYYKWLFELAILLPDNALVEELYVVFEKQLMSVEKYEIALAEKKSELILEIWLKRIRDLDLSTKHLISKRTLLMYPEEISRLIAVIDECNIEKLTDNVKKMAEEAGVEWSVAARVIDTVDEKTSDEKTDLHEETNGNTNKEVGISNGVLTDDFGNEYDLSELIHLLNL